MGRLYRLTECETLTMKCIWDAGREVTCEEIVSQLKEKYGVEYKDTTVYTYLHKLIEKKFIDCVSHGRKHYFPIVQEDDYIAEYLGFMRSFWFKDSTELFFESIVKMEKEEKRRKGEA